MLQAPQIVLKNGRLLCHHWAVLSPLQPKGRFPLQDMPCYWTAGSASHSACQGVASFALASFVMTRQAFAQEIKLQ